MHRSRLFYYGHGSLVTDVLKNAPPSKPTVTSPMGWVEHTATDPVNKEEPKVSLLSNVKIV